MPSLLHISKSYIQKYTYISIHTYIYIQYIHTYSTYIQLTPLQECAVLCHWHTLGSAKHWVWSNFLKLDVVGCDVRTDPTHIHTYIQLFIMHTYIHAHYRHKHELIMTTKLKRFCTYDESEQVSLGSLGTYLPRKFLDAFVPMKRGWIRRRIPMLPGPSYTHIHTYIHTYIQ